MKNRILLVDDNPTNIKILQESLDDQCDLKVAMSGEEALELAPEFKPSVVLLDIMMPGIDGYETCRKIRQNNDLKFTKVIMVSAKINLSERLEGYKVGADDYITKPFDEEELLAKVRVFLRMKFLQEIDKLKAELFSSISHQIRTPLNNILGFGSLLEQSSNLAEGERMHLQRIIESGHKILDFSQKMLLLYNLPEQTATSLRTVLISEVIERVVRNLQSKSIKTNVSLFLKNNIEHKAILDEYLIEQAFTFIIENAIDYSSSNHNVSVVTGEDEQSFLIHIGDEGASIDDASMEEGSGGDLMLGKNNEGKRTFDLNCIIAKNIVELHGGRFSMCNNSNGGVTVVIALPIEKK